MERFLRGSNLTHVCLLHLFAALSLFLRCSNDVERAGSPEHLLGANFQVLLILDQEQMAFLVHPVEFEGASLSLPQLQWPGVVVLRIKIGWFLLSHL